MTDELLTALTQRDPVPHVSVATVASLSPFEVDLYGERLAAIDGMPNWAHTVGDVVRVIRDQGDLTVIGTTRSLPATGVVAAVASGVATVTAGGLNYDVQVIGAAPIVNDPVAMLWTNEGGFLIGKRAATTAPPKPPLPPPLPRTSGDSLPDTPPSVTEKGETILYAQQAGCARLGAWRTDTWWLSQGHYATAPTPLVSESFSTANGTTPQHLMLGRTPSGGGVSVQSSRAEFTTGDTGSYSANDRVNRRVTLDGITPLSIGDVDITFSFVYVSGESYPSVIVRCSQAAWNGQTGYLLEFNNGVFAITRAVNYTYTTIATIPWTYTTGTTYKARFNIEGSLIKAWIGTSSLPGSPQLSVTDTAITGPGFITLNVAGGAAATSSKVAFDDLVVNSISAVGAGSADSSGYWFYGAQLSKIAGVVVESASIWLRRITGDVGSAAAVHLAHHNEPVKPSTPPATAGAYSPGSLTVGQEGWFPLSLPFAQGLADRSWAGLAMVYAGTADYMDAVGIDHPNPTLRSPNSGAVKISYRRA